jgi:hypothetical protein
MLKKIRADRDVRKGLTDLGILGIGIGVTMIGRAVDLINDPGISLALMGVTTSLAQVARRKLRDHFGTQPE